MLILIGFSLKAQVPVSFGLVEKKLDNPFQEIQEVKWAKHNHQVNDNAGGGFPGKELSNDKGHECQLSDLCRMDSFVIECLFIDYRSFAGKHEPKQVYRLEAGKWNDVVEYYFHDCFTFRSENQYCLLLFRLL